MKKSIYAVVDVKNTIKSKWFVLEGNKVIDVTNKLYSLVNEYNQLETTQTKIPFSYKSDSDMITYSFGCGLTHYLQNENLKELAAELNVDHIEVFTTNDLTMYGFKKTHNDWEGALSTILNTKRVML